MIFMFCMCRDQSFTDQLTEGLAREVATVHKQINECKATIAGNQRTIAEMRGLPAPKQEVDDLDTTAMTEGESFVGELDVTTDNNQSFTDELTEGLTREVASVLPQFTHVRLFASHPQTSKP